jgi:hypothetical protein
MTQLLSSPNIRRELLANSDITGIRKKMLNDITEAQRGDYIKMGDALEQLVNTEGWVYLQEYMMKHIMNGMLGNESSENNKGFINLMHFIDQVIRAKDEMKARMEENRSGSK